MEIVFVVYHDLKTEARSQEMLELLKMYGHVTLVSYCNTYPDPEIDVVCNKNESKGIFGFLKNAYKTIKKVKPQMVMLHDQYPVVLVPFIKKTMPDCVIIHDSSELRLLTEEPGRLTLKKRVARLFMYAEHKYSKEADVTIAANRERAEIMKGYFSLPEMPIVFDNIHKIEVDYDLDVCRKKFDSFFDQDAFYVLYAGGIAEKRQTYKIVDEIGTLGNDYWLIIVGSVEIDGEKKLQQLISEKGISNVNYLGFVSREELKYLMEKSNVSISTFAMDTVNNINCASGKVYEGLFLGKPLLAGLNPPLKYLCEIHGVGVSTENFGEGCRELKNNYITYCDNVKAFVEELNYEDRIVTLKKQIDAVLNNSK